jgi:lactoylglutathione lyase
MTSKIKLGYVIAYVQSVPKTIQFYEKAFGLSIRRTHEDCYGEMETGSATLSFYDENFAKDTSCEFIPNRLNNNPAGIEIAFIVDDVQNAFDHAIKNGAIIVKEPIEKPWGQTVAYIKDINGILIELCSEIQN